MRRKRPAKAVPASPPTIGDLLPGSPSGIHTTGGKTALLVPDCDSPIELQSFLEQLHSALASKPRELVLQFIGVHQMSPDPALLIHHVLQDRDPGIRLRTEALSPIIGPGVLLWLVGDTRYLRPTAWLYLMTSPPRRRMGPPWIPEPEPWQADSRASETNLSGIDLNTVLELVNQYLPVQELGDKPIKPEVLREFGLIDGDRFDEALKAVLTPAPACQVPSEVNGSAGAHPDDTPSKPAASVDEPHPD